MGKEYINNLDLIINNNITAECKYKKLPFPITISHITLIVDDLGKTTDMLKYLFNAKEIYDSGDKHYSYSREKFFLINDIWFVIMEGESLPTKTYNHIAFLIDKEDHESYVQKINELGLEIKSARSRVNGEGYSTYFYDYDNHLFELHTGTLQERLNKYISKK